MKDNFIEELTQIHRDTLKSLKDRDFGKFTEISETHLGEIDDIKRINKLKIVLIVSKGFHSDTHPCFEVKQTRDKVLAEYNRLYATLK